MWIQRSLGSAIVTLSCVASAAAQPARSDITSAHVPGLGSRWTAEFLADLPFGENVYSVLETTQAEVIADTFNSGGLNVGATARTAGFLGSWTQTRFRIGDVDITDPSTGGSPLLFPELFPWQTINVRTGLMSAGLNTPGLGVTLEPFRPTDDWTSTLQSSGSGGSLATKAPLDAPPPIARLQRWAQGSALFSGPLSPGLGVVAGGSWARSSAFAREVLPATDAERGSGFVHLVHTPSSAVEWRTLGWVQRTRVPFSNWQAFGLPGATTRDVSVHVQSTWEHRAPDERRWRAFGAYTGRSRDNSVPAPTSVVVERLEDGPIPALVASTPDSTVRRLTLGGRIAPFTSMSSASHDPELGMDLERTSALSSGGFTGAIAERLDGLPARLWEFVRPSTESHRHATNLALFATDRMTLSPATTLDAGVRLELVRGSAQNATNGVSWTTVMPHATLRWQFADAPPVAFIVGYGRSANQLLLDSLAYGDPFASTGIVSRWLGTPLPPAPGAPIRGAIMDLLGPGTGGNANFVRIADDLKRPYTDEFVVGIESLRHGWLRVSMTGVARRQANLIGLVDTGVPLSSYSTIGIPDPGHDFFGAEDDQVLQIYNRLPSSYARNQYVLDNPGQQAATSYAFKLAAEGSTERVFVLIGATAYMSAGSASRGFLPIENDQDVVGDLFTNPNAATFARGRLFSDRAFTAKWTTVYRFPGDLHVGVIARYQDGQPFSRFVLAPTLNQGPDVVRAYPNGGNRFTFTGTLDLRVKKGFTVGSQRVEALLDAYNLFTRSNEVEEYVMTGPNFRTPTAIEPTPSVHLGLRVVF